MGLEEIRSRKSLSLLVCVLAIRNAVGFMPRTTLVGKPAASRQHLVMAAPLEETALPACELEEADDDADPVVLRSTKTGRVIECYLHSLAKIDKDPAQYIVAVPCDPCVEICQINKKTDELKTIDEEDLKMDALFPIAAALLEEDELTLVRSATTLTLQGIWV